MTLVNARSDVNPIEGLWKGMREGVTQHHGYKYLYRLLKAEIMQAINDLEDRLYTAAQTVNFTPILERITATLSRLVVASSETKKTLINSVIQRLDVGGGEIIHLTPSPWARPFF